MESTNINNGTDPTVANQTTVERTERKKYNIPILSDRETDLSKINPRMRWEQISEYIDLTYQKKLEELIEQGTGPTHNISHQRRRHMGIGLKSETRDFEGPKGKRTQSHQLTRIAELFKKTFLPTRNVFHSRAQFFEIRQEDGET